VGETLENAVCNFLELYGHLWTFLEVYGTIWNVLPCQREARIIRDLFGLPNIPYLNFKFLTRISTGQFLRHGSSPSAPHRLPPVNV
jgi:hypothetical protein